MLSNFPPTLPSFDFQSSGMFSVSTVHDCAFFLNCFIRIGVNYHHWIMSSHTFSAKDFDSDQFQRHDNPSVIYSMKVFMVPGEVKDSVLQTNVRLLVLKTRHIQRQLNSLHLVSVHRGANASMGESDSMKKRLPWLGSGTFLISTKSCLLIC